MRENERWAREVSGEGTHTQTQLELSCALPRNVLLTGAQGGIGLRLTEQLYQLLSLQPLVQLIARSERLKQQKLMHTYANQRRAAFGQVPDTYGRRSDVRDYPSRYAGAEGRDEDTDTGGQWGEGGGEGEGQGLGEGGDFGHRIGSRSGSGECKINRS